MLQRDKPSYNVKWTTPLKISWVLLYIWLFLLWYFCYQEFNSQTNLNGDFFLYLFAVIPSVFIFILHYVSCNLSKVNYPVLITSENYLVQYSNARIILTGIGYFILMFFTTLFLSETKKELMHPKVVILVWVLLFILLKIGLWWFVFKSFQGQQNGQKVNT